MADKRNNNIKNKRTEEKERRVRKTKVCVCVGDKEGEKSTHA